MRRRGYGWTKIDACMGMHEVERQRDKGTRWGGKRV